MWTAALLGLVSQLRVKIRDKICKIVKSQNWKQKKREQIFRNGVFGKYFEPVLCRLWRTRPNSRQSVEN